MSMFTLAFSCLIISNLPWFMDLTFQISMQYCSLQHQTLLPSPIISTIGCCFCFGSLSSFFLELVLHWSPVAYWAPTNLRSLSFSALSFCLFILSWGSQSKNTEVVCLSLLPWPVLCQLSAMTHPFLVALHGMAHSFIELDKAVVHMIRLVSFLWLWFSVCLPSDGEGKEAYGSFLMGKTDWGGKLGLVLMGRAMLSKSLIQFSIKGRAVFSLCY